MASFEHGPTKDESGSPTVAGPVDPCDAFADLLTADALDVLEPQDEPRLRRHLESCPSCRTEHQALRDTAARLALSVPVVDPPAALRGEVVAAARRERPPLLHRVRRPFRGLRRAAPMWGAVAASLIVSTVSLLWAASLQNDLSELSQQAQTDRERADRYDTVVRVLASEQLLTRPLAATPSAATAPSGMAYLDPASGRGMVMVHDLPPLPAGRAWQVWYVRGSERMSGGLMRTDPAGTAYAIITVPANVTAYEALGISEEPSGGSDWPTTPGVVTASF